MEAEQTPQHILTECRSVKDQHADIRYVLNNALLLTEILLIETVYILLMQVVLFMRTTLFALSYQSFHLAKFIDAILFLTLNI